MSGGGINDWKNERWTKLKNVYIMFISIRILQANNRKSIIFICFVLWTFNDLSTRPLKKWKSKHFTNSHWKIKILFIVLFCFFFWFLFLCVFNFINWYGFIRFSCNSFFWNYIVSTKYKTVLYIGCHSACRL